MRGGLPAERENTVAAKGRPNVLVDGSFETATRATSSESDGLSSARGVAIAGSPTLVQSATFVSETGAAA